MTPRPTTIDLAGALPSRPVAVTPPPTVAPLDGLGMFALLFALLGGLLWWLGPDLARDWRIGGAAPAENVRIEEGHNLVPPRGRVWVYLYDDGGRQERAFVELPSKDRPLFTDTSETRALALRGERGGIPLLLDARLGCLDLTGSEKAAFYTACDAAFGGRAGADAG